LSPLPGGGGGRLRKGAEDPAGVKPARAETAEDLFPVDVARAELRDGGVAAIGTAERGADAEAAFGEVQPVPDRSSNAVVLHPLHALLDATLEHQVFHQTADGIVGQRCDDGGAEAETAPQSARDVVFAAAFPYLECSGRVD